MEGIRWMAEQYVASGLVYAYDVVTQGIITRAYQELLSRGQLPLRIALEIYHELMPHLVQLGIIQGFGNAMLKIGGIKIFADGAISARTAAVAEPYLDRHPTTVGNWPSPGKNYTELSWKAIPEAIASVFMPMVKEQ